MSCLALPHVCTFCYLAQRTHTRNEHSKNTARGVQAAGAGALARSARCRYGREECSSRSAGVNFCLLFIHMLNRKMLRTAAICSVYCGNMDFGCQDKGRDFFGGIKHISIQCIHNSITQLPASLPPSLIFFLPSYLPSYLPPSPPFILSVIQHVQHKLDEAMLNLEESLDKIRAELNLLGSASMEGCVLCWVELVRRLAGVRAALQVIYIQNVFGVRVLVCVYRSLLRRLCGMLCGACSPSCWCARRSAGNIYRLFLVVVFWCACIGHCWKGCVMC